MLDDIRIQTRKKMDVFGFLVLLFLQVAMMLYFCVNKQEYHIDEIYSYILSNSYHCDCLSNAKQLKDRWINGKASFNEFVAVQPKERFAYEKTYDNNTNDAHPPFYYYILHTVCSFFPDRFSKWFGLSINILMFVLTQLLLFLISRKLFNGLIWQLLPMALYGFSPIAVDIVLFIRMYSLLALFTVLMFYVHLKMLEGELKIPYVWCFVITFLGVFTQYFFAISAFYLALICCVVFWKNKKFRDLLYYSVSMMSGVLLVFLVYPAAFRQTTGSNTNNVGNEVSSNIMNFAALPDRLSLYRQQFSQRMFRNWKWHAFYIVVLCIVILLSVTLRNKKGKKEKPITPNAGSTLREYTFAWLKNRLVQLFQTNVSVDSIKGAFMRKKTMYVFITGMIMLLNVLTVAHISGKFAYLRYLYNIMPILFFWFIAIFYFLSSLLNVNKRVLSAGLMVFALVIGANTVVKKNCEYLFEGRCYVVNNTMGFLDDKPLVLIDKNKNHMLTGNLTLLASVDQMYISDTDEINIDELTQDMDVSDGVAFLVLDNTEWSEGYFGDETMQKIVDASDKFSTYEKYGDELYSTMYWVY